MNATTTTTDDVPLPPPFAPPPLQSIENTTTNDTTTNNNSNKNAYEIERDMKVSMNLARLKALGIDVAREKLDLENAKKKTKKYNNASRKRTECSSPSEPRVTRRQRMMQNETS